MHIETIQAIKKFEIAIEKVAINGINEIAINDATFILPPII